MQKVNTDYKCTTKNAIMFIKCAFFVCKLCMVIVLKYVRGHFVENAKNKVVEEILLTKKKKKMLK